jgi:hypothetical protein
VRRSKRHWVITREFFFAKLEEERPKKERALSHVSSAARSREDVGFAAE